VPQTLQRLVANSPRYSKNPSRQKSREIVLASGTVLLREWAERDHKVVVTAEGKFAYDGPPFRSLSAVTRCIVSFSAVTQQINSTASMGRLVINVLLSFAQFKPEVTGDRIPDKIAASKREGLWMGGGSHITGSSWWTKGNSSRSPRLRRRKG
jgi:hypothetical protein